MSAPESDGFAASAASLQPFADEEAFAPIALTTLTVADTPVAVKGQAAPLSVRRQVLALAWPVVAEQVLFTLVGLVDVFVVGHLGAGAIGGVGLAGQAVMLAYALFSGLGAGTTALVARHIGAREPDEASQLTWQSLVVAVVLSVLAGGVAYIWAEPIIQLLGGDPEVVALGGLWLRVFALSMPGLAVLFVGNAALRGAGDTRTPLAVMALVNVLNVIIAWVGVRMLEWGVFGSALGATVGQLVGGVVVALVLWRGSKVGLRLANQVRGLDTVRVKRVLNVGLAASVEQLLLQLALVVMGLLVTRLSTAAYAAYVISLRISSIAFLPGWGFAVSASSLVGQALGRRDYKHATESGYESFYLAFGVMVGLGLVVYALAGPIVGAMTSDPEVLVLGVLAVQASMLAQAPMAGSFVFGSSLRGAGDTRTALMVTVASIWAVRLTLGYVFTFVLGWGLLGIWAAVACDFAVRAVVFWRHFRGGRWQTLQV